MKIEDQVCTLEQAKRLNELGIKQGLSIFFYDEYREGLVYNNSPTGGYFNAESCFSAFTVAELGCMLPDWCLNMGALHKDDHLETKQYYYGFWKTGNQWCLRFADYEDYPIKFYKTQAQCYATYLIHLIETKNITPE